MTRVAVSSKNASQLPVNPLRLPVFDYRSADCLRCSLDEKRQREGAEVVTEIGADYRHGGLMIVGESPGRQEVLRKRPFVGDSGRLLDDLLTFVKYPRSKCIIANAAACHPPGKLEESPGAVEACNGRLFLEIQAYKPRVIVALGEHAIRATVGHEAFKKKRNQDECDACGGAGQVMLSAAGWLNENTRTKRIMVAGDILIKCKQCNGKGARNYAVDVRLLDYHTGVLDTAGAVLDLWNNPELAHRRGSYPIETRYVIGTYHPAFMLRESDDNAKLSGQYFLPWAAHHLRRAIRLLTSEFRYNFDPFVIADDSYASAECLYDWLAKAPNRLYAVDIETEAMDSNVKIEHEWVPDEIRGAGYLCTSCSLSDAAPEAGEGCTETALAPDDPRKTHLDPLRERIVCFGIARNDTPGVCVVVLKGAPKAGYRWQILKEFMGDETRGKVFHNGVFDIAVIENELNGGCEQ